MLRLVSEIGHVLANIDGFRTSHVWMPRDHFDEVEPIMKFLNTQLIITTQTGSNGRAFIIKHNVPINTDLSLGFAARIPSESFRLCQEKTNASELRMRLLFLYMARHLEFKADRVLEPLCVWVDGVLDRSGWRSSAGARKWIRFIQLFYCIETNASCAFRNLLKNQVGWTFHHAPYLARDYQRFIKEPRFSFLGISDDELADYYHEVGFMVSVYNETNELLEEPTRNRSLLCDRLLKRTIAFMCASKLKPENPTWERDWNKAQEELLHYFPRYGRQELSRECGIYYYTNIDGEERTWLQNGICFLG